MSLRIILADGHNLVREGVACLLSREPDIEVVGTVGNGRDAVTMAAELKPDLILCDVALPQLNGADATLRILENDSSIRVLALSQQSDPPSVSRMMRAGACGYVLKGASYNELIDAIRTVMTGETFLSPAVAGGVVREYIRRSATACEEGPAILTEREREVLQLVAEGHRTRDIAETLGVSIKTIENHRKGVMTKLGVNSIAELTKYAVRNELTSLEY
jgi:DNA-binding NarL/FixJ family response regulator